MKRLLTFIFAICVSVVYSQGRIDGFYKGKNKGSIVLGLGFEDGIQYFSGGEVGKLDISRSVFYTNVFGAYGLAENLDVNLAIPYIISDDNANFQDISAFLKYRLISLNAANGRIEISTAAGFSTNLTNYELGGLNDIGQQATIIDLKAMIHYQLVSGWFATLQGGYAFKSDPTPNSLPATLKAGHAGRKWYYDLYYDFQHSFGGIDYRGTPPPQDFRAFGVDFQKIGGTLYKPFSSTMGVYVSVSYVFDGRNIFKGPGYGTGLVYNFGN